MADRFFKMSDGNVVETETPSEYRVTQSTLEDAEAAVAAGTFIDTFDPEDAKRAWPEQCVCEAGMGGCRQTISLTCSPDAVQPCIETLVANCDR